MTKDLLCLLMASGLSKQQATSVTAETLVELFTKEDGKILIAEAQRQVSEMRAIIDELHNEYDDLMEKLSAISDTFVAIKKAQEEYGEVTDEKAREVVSLYGALLTMNERMGADANESIKNAGYIIYAFLGGQARRGGVYISEQARDGIAE